MQARVKATGSSDAPAAKRGRTTLTPAPGGAGSATRTRTIQLLPAVISAAGFAPGSLVVTEGGQARLPRHLFAPGGAHGAMGATTRPGSSVCRPAIAEGHAARRARGLAVSESHAAAARARQRISPSRRP